MKCIRISLEALVFIAAVLATFPASGAWAGIEGSGGTIRLPYIPNEPFRYDCQLKVEGSAGSGPRWQSEIAFRLDNENRRLSDVVAGLVWTTKVKAPGMRENFKPTTKRPPYDLTQLDVWLYFEYPESGKALETYLSATLWETVGTTRSAYTGHAIGTFDDVELATRVEASHYPADLKKLSSTRVTLRCRKQVLPE